MSKEESQIRVVFKNIGGLRSLFNNEREIHLKDWIKQNEVDVIGNQETNINCSLCFEQERPLQRFRSLDWCLFRESSSHNKRDKRKVKKTQYGGFMFLTFDKTASYVDDTGADEIDLGCWSWVLITSVGFSVRFTSAYKAVPIVSIHLIKYHLIYPPVQARQRNWGCSPRIDQRIL